MRAFKQKHLPYFIRRLPTFLLLSLVLFESSYALLTPGDTGAPPPAPQPPQEINMQPQAVGMPTPPPPQSAPTGKPLSQQAIEQDLTQMSPQQTRALIDRVKSLKPQQIEEISKAVQSQVKLDDNTGLIESVEPATAVTTTTTTTTAQSAQVLAPVGTSAPVVVQGTVAVPTQVSLTEAQSITANREEEAFNTVVEDVLPMSPDQIMKLHKYYDMTLKAKAAPANPPPDPRFTSTLVNLEPGGSPPIVRLSAGFVTSLVFIDSSGSPWPISAYSIGDPQNFNVQWDQKGNTLFVQSMKQYSHGNLAVRLYNFNTPVMITLVSGQKNVDFRVDLQIPGRGPNAVAPVIDTPYEVTAKVSTLMLNLLDGIPPKGSIKLGVAGAPGDAWFYDHKVYFRSKLTVLSPAWTATTSSPDGTHVYEMTQTPRILASQNGKTVDIKLSGL